VHRQAGDGCLMQQRQHVPVQQLRGQGLLRYQGNDRVLRVMNASLVGRRGRAEPDCPQPHEIVVFFRGVPYTETILGHPSPGFSE